MEKFAHTLTSLPPQPQPTLNGRIRGTLRSQTDSLQKISDLFYRFPNHFLKDIAQYSSTAFFRLFLIVAAALMVTNDSSSLPQ